MEIVTYISPPIVAFVDVESSHIICSGAIRAVGTCRVVRWVYYVSRIFRKEAGHVFGARGVRRERNGGELIRIALHLDIPCHRLEKSTDKIRKGVEVVQPVFPERLKL